MIKRPRLLVFEDDPASRKIVGYIAKKFDWDAICVADAEQGLALIADPNCDPTVVLMDYRLGKISGTEAAKQIREMEKRTGKRIPIIALTASAMPGDRERCIEAGMDDYLSKPYTIEQFEETVRKWL